MKSSTKWIVLVIVLVLVAVWYLMQQGFISNPVALLGAVAGSANQDSVSTYVKTPNGGEKLMLGSVKEIRWWPSGKAGELVSVRLLDAQNNHLANIALRVPNTGFFSWQVGRAEGNTDVRPGDYKVRVCQKESDCDKSDATFRIVKPTTAIVPLKLISPNGGEKIKLNKATTITWQADPGIRNINIRLRDGMNEMVYLVATVPASVGSFTWIPVQTNDAKYGYSIMIENTDNPWINDQSDNFFTLEPR